MSEFRIAHLEIDSPFGNAGGVVAGVGTTFFYESQDWKHDVDRLLREYVEVS